MKKYTAKDLMILAHLTPLGMDALTDLVMNDMFGRDMNAIVDSAIITYWQYVKEEEENLGTTIGKPDEEENDVDVDWNEVLDPWTFGGM